MIDKNNVELLNEISDHFIAAGPGKEQPKQEQTGLW
jgi:hypothetical protein